jgi:hypothetical protein
LFNAALVTPTYYVYFTSSTIITSAILFRGFKGTVTSIITVVMGFFVICAGVVLLQLSKSAKDVPDTAVFAGDLDQLRTIAEQEQPESEPKADAIRGAAAIVRRFSTARQKWELDEARRLHDEKQQDLEPVAEGEHIEWDGLRRRRTTYGTNPSIRSRGNTTPFPLFETVHTPQQHPPLGMSHFPSDSSSDSEHDEERPNTAGLGSSFFGSIRTRAKSVIAPSGSRAGNIATPQSPMHPVPLTEISIPAYKAGVDGSTAYYGHDASGPDHSYGLAPGMQDQKTEYEGAAGERQRRITIVDDADSRRTGSRGSSLNPVGPTPPPHSARRQFSFQNVFRKGQATHGASEESVPQSRSPMVRKGLGGRRSSHGAAVKGATEEERLGLVKGDTNIGRQPVLPAYEDEDEEEDSWMGEDKPRITSSPEHESPRRDLTPPRRGSKDKDAEVQKRSPEDQYYDSQARKWDGKGRGPPPPFNDGKGGAFI